MKIYYSLVVIATGCLSNKTKERIVGNYIITVKEKLRQEMKVVVHYAVNTENLLRLALLWTIKDQDDGVQRKTTSCRLRKTSSG
jgi:hypothetical protein